MIVENLYGVTPGAHDLITGEEIQIKASRDLRKELRALPPGTSVGLEYTPLFDEVVHSDIEFSTVPYWKDIIAYCKKYKLEPIFLDTYQIYHDKIIPLTKELANLYHERSDENNDPVIDIRRSYKEDLFKTKVELDYAHQVERVDHLVEKIIEHRPKVVILSKGNADSIMMRRNELHAKNLGIITYKQEIPDKASEGVYITSKSGVIYTYLEKGEPDPMSLKKREFLIRKHNAATVGRVQPQNPNTPVYIGTWKIECRPEGLFELFVTEQKDHWLQGTIEDNLGSATFAGQFTDEHIRFVKRYSQDKTIPYFEDAWMKYRPLPGDIVYEGDRMGDFFVGEWTSSEISGDFFLHNGTALMDPLKSLSIA